MSDGDTITERPGLQPPDAWRPVVRGYHRDRDFALRRALLVADMLGLWLSLAVSMSFVDSRALPLEDSLWIAPTLPFWALLFWSYRLYGRSIRSFEPTHVDDLPSLFHALVLGTLGLWLFYRFVAPVPQLNLAEVLFFGLLALPLIATLRAALRANNLRRQGPERVFTIAPPEDVRLLRRKLDSHPEYEMALAGTVAGAGCEELGLELCTELDEVEELIASGEIEHLMVRLDSRYLPQERALELMQVCHREGIRFSCFPAARGLLPHGTEINHLEGMGFLTANPPVLSRTARTLKRGLDVGVAALLLVLLAPLLALIALAVRLDSRGPSLYRQIRVGKDGRRFELLKFRTMVEGAEKLTAELMERSVDPNWLDIEDDPRVTRVGRFLRRTSLDELPQLWNVLKGKMSLVGPRPLSLHDDAKVLGWRRHRLDLTPGVTGYWQVLGRNSIPFQEMLEVDYAYVASWSLWHDIRILLQTVPVVLRRRGAN
jgi:exopolysaccharide biosynthesis polyprenyl glycosylphosphotransferase